jgi:pimeloyl-ACP methyl ester carboxylesterase
VGSIYAIHGVSLFPDIAGLIIESGIAEVFERLLLRVHPEELNISLERMEEEVAAYFNMQKKLQNYNGPLLVMHAKHDSLVHYSHGQRIYDWSPQPEGVKTLNIFENGDHNDIFAVNAQDYIRRLAAFLNSAGATSSFQTG